MTTDRPREQRRSLALAAHLTRSNGQVLDIELLDLSSGGCKVRATDFLWVGDRLSLSVPGKGVIGCKVKWSKGGFAGLEFDAEAAPTPVKTEKPRANARHSTKSQVRLRRVGSPNYNVTIQDLSLDGCKVEMIDRAQVGQTVQINFPGLATVEARVQWTDGFIAGLAFNQAFHPAVFEILVDRLSG